MYFVIFPNRFTFLIKFILGNHSETQSVVETDRWLEFYVPSLVDRAGARKKLAG